MNPPTEHEIYTIRVHHVGGRDGEIGEWNNSFLQDHFFYIYDADERCLPQVVQLNTERGRRVQVLPYIIDEHDQSLSTININYCACSSSLATAVEFPPEQYSPSPLLGDYVYNECFRTVEQISAKTRSIDSLAEEKKFSVDFVGIDTNGTENRVIKGARHQLQKHGLAVTCEVEFQEIYKDQALFGDVASLLRGMGYHFMRFFDRGVHVNYYRGGIGWRGDGLVMIVDALFMKDLGQVEAQNANPQAGLLKLALLALGHGYVEYALDALVRAFEKYDRSRLPAVGGPRYIEFLKQVYSLYRATPQFNRPKFSDLWTAEEGLRRFDAGKQVHPWLQMDLTKARRNYFSRIDMAEFRRHFPRLLQYDDTPFEALLRQNGFASTADLVRNKRIDHARMTVKSLQLAHRQRGEAVIEVGLGSVDTLNALARSLRRATRGRGPWAVAARSLAKKMLAVASGSSPPK
jgi:FkbM family methyltransferase